MVTPAFTMVSMRGESSDRGERQCPLTTHSCRWLANGTFRPLADLTAQRAVTLWHTLEAPHALLTRFRFVARNPTGAGLALKPLTFEDDRWVGMLP